MKIEFSEQFQGREDKDSFDFGVHWRYNRNDWSNRCKFNNKTSQSPKECEIINQIDFRIVKDKWSRNYIERNVYIAAPSDEILQILARFSQRKSSIFDDDDNDEDQELINFYSAQDILKFLNKNQKFFSCSWKDLYLPEIISLMEQVILAKFSDTVFYWPSSSWSNRVLTVRRIFTLEEGLWEFKKKNINFIDFLESCLFQ